VGKHHRYLTVVLDLLSGAVVYVGDGKGADALLPFWRKLKRSQASITAVAMDMSPAYIAAVTEHLPKATIVFDHFHLIKLLNDKLAALRRDLQREAQQAGKQVLKGTRWLLLKNQENLKAERNEQQVSAKRTTSSQRAAGMQ
jgi:transposase